MIPSQKKYFTKNIIIWSSLGLSLVAEIFLIFIIYFNSNKIPSILPSDIQSWISALMNGLSAISLYIAWLNIKKGKQKWHILFIHFALFFSSLFLINYILYHLSVGHVKFTNENYQFLYFGVLITHLLGSIIVLPMIFSSYFLGISGHLKEHKKLAKFTFFLWEYVSVTGVLIVFMLKFLNDRT